jgi:hypothetical protein
LARIFLSLALLAILLLTVNLGFALAVGDFGAASQRYVAARTMLRALHESREASPDQLAAQRKQAEQLAQTLRRQRERFWPHIWLGIGASLISLLVNSISITYFIGTARWCREVVEAYRMPADLVLRSQRLKRRSFLWALGGILTTLAIAGLGAAADPYASTANPARWVVWHLTAALIGIAIISVSFVAQAAAVRANHQVIQTIVAAAREKG